MAQRPSTLDPLKFPTFRAIWFATLLSNLGGLVQGVAAGWTMTTLTDSYNMVALVQAAITLPIMLFSLLAGALADSFDRRDVMLVAQILMMTVSTLLAVLTYLGLLTPWLLLALTFLIGCGVALNNPSWQASLGDMVPRENLPSAVTLNAMSFNLMRSVGPAIGGVIVAWFGVAVAFLFNAASYIALIAALWGWKPQRSVDPRLPRERIGPAVSSGLRYVSMSPNLMKVMARGCLFGIGAVAVLALLPSVANEYVGGDAVTYGTMLGAFGVGAIIAAFANNRIRERFSNEWIIRVACSGFAASAIVLGFSRDAILSHAALLPAGACWVLTMSLFNVSVQLSTPRWVVGRTLSIYQTATFGGMAAGSWLWGAVADVLSPDRSLYLSALVLLGCALFGLRFALPAFSSQDLNPLNTFNEPALRLDLKPRSGPILVMVEYDIAQEDTPEYLKAMVERRRVRIRDGARQWALLRDLERPNIWTESYHVPTWDEYVRHNLRRTVADAAVTERLRKLHRGPVPLIVHRMIERQTVPLADDTPIRDMPEPH